MRAVRVAAFTPVLSPVAAAAPAGPVVHTDSIVARNPKTGEMGVAVQSHWFSVGSIVTWGEAEAAPILKRVLGWADLIPRLPVSRQLPDDQALVKRLVSLRPPKQPQCQFRLERRS
jgi:hypothetical protein